MLFGKKERQTEELIRRHLDVVGEVVVLLQQTVSDYCSGNAQFKEKAAKVRSKEHDADEVRRDVEAMLYDGAFLPVERGDYVRLLEAMDKIANNCEAVADFLSLTRPELDEGTKDGLIEIMEVTARCYTHFPSIFESFDDGRAVLSLARQVEEDERAVDQLFASVVRSLFKDDSIDLAHKIHIKMLLDRSASISNRMEDASDMFAIIVSKRP